MFIGNVQCHFVARCKSASIIEEEEKLSTSLIASPVIGHRQLAKVFAWITSKNVRVQQRMSGKSFELLLDFSKYIILTTTRFFDNPYY